MTMNWLQSLIIGFVSGLAEILPVSPEAHRMVLCTLFGVSENGIFRLMIHIACLLSVYTYLRGDLNQLRRAARLMAVPPKRRKKPLSVADANTVRLMRSAIVMLLILRFLAIGLDFVRYKLNLLPAGLILTGALLLIPRLVRNGNMDSRNMPRINGLLMGLGAGLGGVPGCSATGCAMSLGQWQGVSSGYALKFACCLLLPGLGCHILADVVSIVSAGAVGLSLSVLLSALAGAVASFFGCRAGLRIMQSLSISNGYSAFSYYCWGIAMLCFALFLTI